MGGFAGFDLSNIQTIFEAYDIPQYEWRFVLDKIGILASIASKYWNTDTEKPKEDPK